MSYARFGPGSDVYVFPTTISDRMGGGETRVIECCNCMFTSRDEEGRCTEPFPRFASRRGILAHLQQHRAANWLVPDETIRKISEDGWLPEDVEKAARAQLEAGHA